jgi:PAS domain-containing protein
VKYGWSTDEEHFQGEEDSREAAIEEAIQCHDLQQGDVVFTCEVRTPKGSDFFDIDRFVESMGDAAYDSDAPEDLVATYPDISDEKRAELEKLIKPWLDENCAPDWWVAENVQRHEVPIPE